MKNPVNKNLSGGPAWTEFGFGLGFPGWVDDFVMRGLAAPSFHENKVTTPATNIIETNNEFFLEMVAPGMKKDDFQVELNENVLTISYDHEDNRKGDRKNWNYLMHEYNYHSFTRSFHLPETVEKENIKATYLNGILNLIIPKKEEACTRPGRKIRIS